MHLPTLSMYQSQLVVQVHPGVFAGRNRDRSGFFAPCQLGDLSAHWSCCTGSLPAAAVRMPTRDSSQLSFPLHPKLCISLPKAPAAPAPCACCVSLNASGELSPGAAGFGCHNLCSLFLSPSVLGWIHFNFSYTVSASKYPFKLKTWTPRVSQQPLAGKKAPSSPHRLF